MRQKQISLIRLSWDDLINPSYHQHQTSSKNSSYETYGDEDAAVGGLICLLVCAHCDWLVEQKQDDGAVCAAMC